MTTTAIGIIAGLTIGVVFAWLGALNAFFVALFMLAGWIISKLWLGEIDILELYERFMQSRGGRSGRR
ncbi:hypothetical protein ACFLXA_01155 [Chloroflexota bacterium]|jgi:hypothetical protein